MSVTEIAFIGFVLTVFAFFSGTLLVVEKQKIPTKNK